MYFNLLERSKRQCTTSQLFQCYNNTKNYSIRNPKNSWIPIMPIVSSRKLLGMSNTYIAIRISKFLCDLGLQTNCRGEGCGPVSGFQIFLSWPAIGQGQAQRSSN